MQLLFGADCAAIMRRIYRRIAALSAAFAPLIPSFWNHRYDVPNPLEDIMDGKCTGYIDTFPVRIYQPKNRDWRYATYQPKYKANVMKIQVVVGHTGLPLFMSGPHIGVRHDSKLWLQVNHYQNMDPNEVILGDKAYVGARARQAGLVAPFKGSNLNQEQLDFNIAHSWFRAGVEHFFGHLKRFGAIGARHRGRLYMDQGRLYSIVQICVCILGLRIRSHPLRTHMIENFALPVAPLDVEDEEELNDVVAVANAAVAVARAVVLAGVDEESKHDHLIEAKRGLEWGDVKRDLVEFEGTIIGIGPEPSDAAINTGRVATDFAKEDRVAVWWWGKWYKAIVHYVASKRGNNHLTRWWSSSNPWL